MHTLSDVRDGFSLWPCAGCTVPRCASGTPPDLILLDHLCAFSRSSVLSVASCNVTSTCVRIFLRSPGLSSPPKGTTPEIVHSGLSRLMSSTDHRRPDAPTAPSTVQSYLSARCAAILLSSLSSLAVLVSTRPACFVNLLFFRVLRADSASTLTPSARCT